MAFSGGPDSTALLHAMAAVSQRYHSSVHAAHLDHASDGGSEARARQAKAIAARLGIAISVARRSAIDARHGGESKEEAARRIRYQFLHEVADRLSAFWIATAHHAGDQSETVLLRLLFGSGLAGLAGIPAQRGRVIRPLLDVDGAAIKDYLSPLGLGTLQDPTNLDVGIPRNLVRHRLLPRLRAEDEQIDNRLLSLSRTAARTIPAVDQRVLALLRPQVAGGGLRIPRTALESLPTNLRPYAIGALCREAGAPPPARAALLDLERQLARGSGIGCDLGSGWRLRSAEETLVLHTPETGIAPFAYTLRVPGEIHLSELSLVFRLTQRPAESWMFRGSRRRAGMSLFLSDGDHVTIRNRRPGDRLQPFGCSYSRRLKDILIDRRIPQPERDRIPLLCVNERIVWVPGVTIDESARLGEAQQVWVAELEDAQEIIR